MAQTINAGKIQYGIGFQIDKSGLASLKTQLESLRDIVPTGSQLLKIDPNLGSLSKASKKAYDIQKTITEMQDAFDHAFNSKTGLMNLQKINTSLKNIGIDRIAQNFSYMGKEGKQAFYEITKSALTTEMQFKKTNGLLDKMGQTLMNTLKWQISSSAINRFTGAVQQAYGYVQHLDTSLNDIRIVTGKSADEMERFARTANRAAKSLGASTTDYTEAALIYYQQGLSDEEANARAATTLKAANVTGQSGAAVSEELTAVWNGYKVSAEETELAVDKLAAVAATTAADLEELSVGMSKVASAANNMGVDMDQLNAMIATIVSITRQAPESVGTALKTIFARMSDLKLGDTDEDGLKLGDVSGSLEKVGISILDTNGDLREMGDVIEEVAGKWDTWTKAQQAAIAQSLAGKRQYNNLVALFDNWDMYSQAINTSRNSMGTLQKQQDIYMESTEAHLQVLQTQWEDLYDSLLDTDTINNLIDSLTKVIKLFTELTDSIGGGNNLFLMLGATATRVFGKQLAQGIVNFNNNLRKTRENALQLKAQLENIGHLDFINQSIKSDAAQALIDAQKQASKYYDYMNNEQINEVNNIVEQIGEIKKLEEEWKESTKALMQYGDAMQRVNGNQIVKGKKIGTNDYDITKAPSSAAREAMNLALKQSDQDIASFKTKYNVIIKSYQRLQQVVGNNSSKKISDLNLGKNQKFFNWMVDKGPELQKTFNVLQNTQLFKDVSPTQIINAQKALKDFQSLTVDSTVDEINDAVINLMKTFDKLPDEAKKVLHGFEQIFSQGDRTVEFEEKVKSQADGLKDVFNDIGKENVIRSVTSLVGGLGQVASGITAIKNLGGIWTNEDLTIGEKILQTTTDLGMSLPMMISGFSALKTAFTTLKPLAIQLFTSIKAGLTANIHLLDIIATHPAITVTAAIVAGITAVSLISSKYQKEQERIAEADAKAAKAAEEHTKAVDEQVSKIDELVKKYDELNEKIKNQETTTESARDEIYNLCKQYGLQDLALKALITDYNKLGDVIDEAQAKRKEEQLQAAKEEKDSKKRSLRSSIWKGLSGSQRDNNEIINGRTVSQTIDLSDMGDFERNVTSARSEFYSGLTDLGIEVGDWGHIDINALADAYAKNREGLLDLINNSNVDAAAELRDIIDKNIEQFDKYREIYQSERNLEAENKFATTFKDDIDSINSIANFNQTVQALVRSLTTQDENGVRLFDSETEAEDFVRNYLNGIDKIKEYAKQSDVSSALISGGSKFSEKEIAEQVGKRSSSAIQFLSNNIISANAYDNLDDFFDEYEKRIKYENTKNNRITVNVALNEAASGKEFDEDTLNNLFDNTDLEKKMGISKEDFANKSSKEQKQILVDYYLTAVAEEKKYQEIKKEGLNKEEQDRKKNLEEGLNELQVLKDKYAEQNIGLTLMSADGTPKAFVDKIKNDLQNLQDQIFLPVSFNVEEDSLEDIQEKINSIDLSQYDDVTKEFIQGILDEFSRMDNITEAQEEYQALLEKYPNLFENGKKSADELIAELENLNLKEAESKTIFEKTDYLPALNATKAAIKDLNSEVDNLQSTYQTLQNVVEDYNEDGALTLDNLQALMEMDSLYVATLELENGQLTLNENTYRSIMDAKLQEMRISAAEQFLIELGVIATDAASQANLKFADTSHQASGAIQGVIDKCKEGVNAVTAYAMSLAGVTADAETVKVSAQAFYNRMQFVDELASQPISSILGKGGSSSGSGKEAQHEEYLEREYDIYRKINTELDQISNKLDRIDEIESHSWGVSYLDAIQKENKLLDEQLEKLEEKKALQIGDLGQRKKQLENEGFTFNEDGSLITNAEDRLDALYANYNANYVDKYNSMSADAQEEFEAEMKAEEDRIKQIEDAVGDYEKLYGDYEDLIKELQDLYYKQIEKDVEEFNFEINLKLELSDARKEWNDFWYDVVKDVDSDDFVGQIAKSFGKLGELIGVGGSSNNDVLGLTQHLKETLDEVNTQITTHGLDGLFGTDTKLSEENLTNYRDKLMSALRDAKEEIENISDNYLSMLESAQDMIDKQVEGWENIGDQINHNIELIKLISGENSYDALAKQYEQQYENNLQTIEAQRIGRDYWKERVAEYKELLANAEEGTEEYKTLKKALEESTQKYIEANKNLNASVEESIKNLQEWRKNSISAIMDTLDKSMSGGLGTDMLEQEWKLINDYADQYFDNVERAVNMEEYTNILQDAANATGLTAENQAKINEFMDEELKKLNEKEKLTQYDIDESKARLEILKAEMALQDAQQNKSNMRLRRDSQGNYTYQYTGNEQAIEDAEKAGLTARKAWYELVKKRNKETNDYIIQLEKDRVSLMKQLDEAELAGDTEKAAKIKELLNRNEQQILFAYEEAQKTKQDLFSGTAQYFENVENAEILPMWEATVTQLVDDFAGDKKDSFITACKNAIIDLESIQQAYADQTKEILTTAGIEYQKLVEEGIDPAKDSLEDLNGSNEELAQGLEETNKLLDEMNDKLVEASTAYENFKDDAVSAIQAANQALEELARTHMDVVNQINSTPINSLDGGSSFVGNGGYSNPGGTGGDGSGGGGYTPTETKKNYLFIDSPSAGQLYPHYKIIDSNGSSILEEGTLNQGTVPILYAQVQSDSFANSNEDKGFITIGNMRLRVNKLKGQKIPKVYQSSDYWQFKSGGYTGDWTGSGIDGIGGRMAVLHQKELVLNESDTSNMLAAVKALRQIDVDKLAQSILATSIATAQMQLQTQLLSAQLTGLRDQYESVRNTTINADFSGVRTADEILRAFEELENYGLQQYNTGDASYRSY